MQREIVGVAKAIQCYDRGGLETAATRFLRRGRIVRKRILVRVRSVRISLSLMDLPSSTNYSQAH